MAARTLVALYDHIQDARATVDELVGAGVSRDAINLIANDSKLSYASQLNESTKLPKHEADLAGAGATLGSVLGGLAGLLVGLGAFAIPGVGPIVAAGPLIAAITGAGAGAATGGIIGGLTDLGISESDAHAYAEGVRRGGTLVSVRLEESEAVRVTDIMERHDPVDIESRGSNWRDSGWSEKFDPDASPYEPSWIEQERSRYGIGNPSLSADEDEVLPEQSRRTI